MRIVDLLVVLAIVVVLLRVLRVSSLEGRAGQFDESPSAVGVYALLALLTMSSAIRVWREPEMLVGWCVLAFTVLWVPVAVTVQRRRRRDASLTTE